jgi:hypothetical protein
MKTTLRFHLTPATLTTTNKTNSKCWKGYREKETLTHCCWDCPHTIEITMEVPQKDNNNKIK